MSEAECAFQTDNGAGSDDSLPESWSSLNDEKCIESVRELVNHHVSEVKLVKALIHSAISDYETRNEKIYNKKVFVEYINMEMFQ